MLLVKHLGPVRYSKALKLQEHLLKKHRNILLLLEHPPVYTGGRRCTIASSTLERVNADFHLTKRGGEMTFHGPGQLVGYPLLDLRDYKLGVRAYVELLQRALVDACQALRVTAELNECTGVWVQDRKIAALGIHVQRHLTSHGFALNCNTDLSWFKHIVPCGLTNKGTTSLTEELKHSMHHINAASPGASDTRVITVQDAIPHVARAIAHGLGTEYCSMDVADPSLDAAIDSFLNE